MKEYYKNSEGYIDTTVGKAIDTTARIFPLKLTDTIRTMKSVADVGGYEVLGRICLRDKKTGEVFR